MTQNPSLESQAELLFQTRYLNECRRVHRLFQWLMVAQWIAGIVFALLYTPYTWIGQSYAIHIHVWAAILLGGALSGTAILWTRIYPDADNTRHVVAAAQMMWSALLIHLTGGRIETHFHVFGSLAILSIYRDWKILITATVVVAVDHFFRGVYYPLSAFGIVTESPFRWIEHAAWVLFEVSFLVPGCMRLRDEVRELCLHQTEITEAKKSVDIQVEQRTSMLNTVLHSVPEGIIAADGNGRLVCFNRRASEIMGKDDQDCSASDTFVKDLAFYETDGVTRVGVTQIPLFQAMNGMVISNREMLIPGEAGNILVSVDATPMRSETTDGGVCVFRDITSERKQEHEMRMLREAVDHANEAMFTINPNGEFVGVNDFACNRLQYTRKEILKLLVADILVERSPDGWKKQWSELKSEGTALMESEYVTKNGEVFPVDVSMVFVDYDGSEYVYAFARDITRRKSADAERSRLADELQKAARQAGMAEVATGVLHNVGNILNSVNVSAAMIRQYFETSALGSLQRITDLIREYESSFVEFVRDDDRGQKIPVYIQKVTEALSDERAQVDSEFGDLLKNVNHINEIVSVQQERASFSGITQMLNAAELVEDAMAAVKGSMPDHCISIVENIDPGTPGLHSDKHKILQILVNLIGNAIEAIGEQTTEQPQIRLEVDGDNEAIVFRVIDNGIGIDPAQIDQIFQHGFTTKKQGHGFGLHSSANAATELGGALSVSSEGPGRGATFELRLPVARQSCSVN